MAETKVYLDPNFQIICSASLMGMMMAAIITPAFPTIVEALGISEQSIGLLISVYTLPNLLLVPLSGMMADRFGRKKLIVPSLFLFGIFGGACALAPDFKTLLILRGLQGIGGAPLLAVSNAILGDLFSGQKRAEAMGLNTTVMYAGYVIYPLLGGALAGLAWNYAFLPFLIAIPVGIIALVSLHCPEPKSKESLKDYLRNALRYLRGLKVLWLFSATVITYILLFGTYLTYFSIFLEDHFDASPFTIGLFISIIGLFTAGVSSQLGRFSKRFSVVSLIIGAFVIYALAMAIIPVAPNLWFCVLPTILFSIAHGLNLPSQNIIAAGIAPLEHRAAFMAVQNTMIPLGMTIGPLIMGLAFSFTGLNVTFLIAALIALVIPIMAVIIGKGKLSVG
jgi:MFS transporter, ACDE family, multidrug resistance protein